MELPYYRYEFERKKRRLEAKRRPDGWLNDQVGYGMICHDSRGNLIDESVNPIDEGEGAEDEEAAGHRRGTQSKTQTQTRTGTHRKMVFRIY